MEISTETWMLIFFILFLVMSIWKIWAFLPNRQLEDDDRTEEANREISNLMFEVIQKKKGELTPKELFFAMQEDEDFNSELFWRFNHNRLNQLLNNYYVEHPDIDTIKDIYTKLSKS